MRFFIFLLLSLLIPFYGATASTDTIYQAMQHADTKQWYNARKLARSSGNAELITLTNWRYLLDPQSGASFSETMRFIDQHPNWPYLSTLKQRAETALREDIPDGNQLLTRYQHTDPITGIGKIILAGELSKYASSGKRVARLVREGWIHGDFYAAEEKNIRKTYARILKGNDDFARMNRLLWEKKTSAAKRLLPRLPRRFHALFKTRIALIRHSRKASSLLRSVPQKLQNDPGLIFDRIRYKAKRKDDSGIRAMLLRAPADAPYPEKWWPYRHTQARQAIRKKHYKTATKLLTGHKQLEGAKLAEALWLDGWLNLEFNKRPKKALGMFSQMYESVGYPVSLARAAYWAGRAAKKAGHTAESTNWFHKAAEHPTTFYGQLAALRLNGGTVLTLPNITSTKQSPKNLLEKAIMLCIQSGEYGIATQLLTHAIKQADSDDDISRLTYMGYHEGIPHLSVRSAKKALQKHLICTKAGYPKQPPRADLPIEPALMHAIIRQESEFDRKAKSRAGARGLMQLMPRTARHTARKASIPYSRKRLALADYNIMLGSHYLAMLLDSYNGSYVLAIAAYNAGPGNVNKWIKQIGRPKKNAEHAINWIEKIPFAETRNYVQRVLENIQVYRRLENDNSLELRQDLLR